ncbi:MAG: LTA synthase family protein [Planctomycetes bacterium]|nr:LTA synthase family protein [Planctomycetota bacterium]
MPAVEWLAGLAVILSFPLMQRRMARIACHIPQWPVADAFALAMTVACALLLIALTGSPGAASVVGVIILVLLDRCNKAKYAALREPVILSDAWLVPQLIKFPIFYFAFLTPLNIAIIALAGTAAAALCYSYLPLHRLPAEVRIAFAAVPVIGILLISACSTHPAVAAFWQRFFARFPVSHNANRDAERYGMVGCAFLHGIWLLAFRQEVTEKLAPREDGTCRICRWQSLRRANETTLPHIVVVQAESFVHARTFSKAIGRDWTRHFDQLADDGCAGRLITETFGAYTIRTEFSVITGVDRADLKVAGINPYLHSARSDVGSMARILSRHGYSTICLHPNSGKFFARDRVMPHLGFQTFLDGNGFKHAARYGPFVADRAIGERIETILAEASTPQFVFAITIEAHGPWAKNRLAGLPWPEDASPLPKALTGKCVDGHFAAYARHLRHTDQLIGQLAAILRTLSRPAVLAVYGDHPGCLPHGMSANDSATDFLLWSSASPLNTKSILAGETAIHPHSLGEAILMSAGWLGSS